MNPDESKELKAIASDVREIRQAVLGDKKIGLTGLVSDVAALKKWRGKIDLRVAAIGGGASALVMVAKYVATLVK